MRSVRRTFKFEVLLLEKGLKMKILHLLGDYLVSKQQIHSHTRYGYVHYKKKRQMHSFHRYQKIEEKENILMIGLF